MPAVLIIEAMAQVGGLLLLNSVDDPDRQAHVLHGHRRREVPQAGDARATSCSFELTLLKLKGSTSKMQGEAYVDDQLVAEAELLATVVETSERDVVTHARSIPAAVSSIDQRASSATASSSSPAP